MRKKTSRGARESAIASGWTVQGDPSAEPETQEQDPDPSSGGGETSGGAGDPGRAGADTAHAIADRDPAARERTAAGPDAAAASTSATVTAGTGTAIPAETGDLDADTVLDAPDDVRAGGQFSNVALVVLGVLGGLYLLYAWVWLSWAQYYSSVNQEVASASGALGGALQQIVFWAAPLAPILWFVSVLALNRGASTLKHAVWLSVGAIVLFPLPLISGGAS